MDLLLLDPRWALAADLACFLSATNNKVSYSIEYIVHRGSSSLTNCLTIDSTLFGRDITTCESVDAYERRRYTLTISRYLLDLAIVKTECVASDIYQFLLGATNHSISYHRYY